MVAVMMALASASSGTEGAAALQPASASAAMAASVRKAVVGRVMKLLEVGGTVVEIDHGRRTGSPPTPRPVKRPRNLQGMTSAVGTRRRAACVGDNRSGRRAMSENQTVIDRIDV